MDRIITVLYNVIGFSSIGIWISEDIDGDPRLIREIDGQFEKRSR